MERTNRIFFAGRTTINFVSAKSLIIALLRGIDFVGFRNFAHYKRLRKRNIRNILYKIKLFEKGAIDFLTLAENYQGW